MAGVNFTSYLKVCNGLRKCMVGRYACFSTSQIHRNIQDESSSPLDCSVPRQTCESKESQDIVSKILTEESQTHTQIAQTKVQSKMSNTHSETAEPVNHGSTNKGCYGNDGDARSSCDSFSTATPTAAPLVDPSGDLAGPLDDLPDPPTTCCMSGCLNCVWIEYAEQLSARYRDGGERARRHILTSINDPMMKAFLSMELKQKL